MTWTELVVSVCGIFMSPNLDQHILDVSETYEVDKEIILGVIHQESRCNTQAVGGVGELGLMQISPRWHLERMQNLGRTNLLDPYSNLVVGVDLLKFLKVDKNPYKALAMYNGGYAMPESSKKYAESVIYKSNNYKNKIQTSSI